MGVFNARCGISGLSLRGATQWVLLRGMGPCAFPIDGGYDSYGKIDLYAPHTAAVDRLVADATVLAMAEVSTAASADFEALANAVSDTVFNAPGTVRIGADSIAHTLCDARICEAAALEVEESSDPAWKRAALAKLSLKELAALALGSLTEPAVTIVGVLDSERGELAEALRARFITFAQQAEWMRRWGSWRPVDADGAQLSWAEELACCDAAAARLKGHARLLAVVTELRARLLADWRDIIPELSEYIDVAGARAEWRPRRPGEAAGTDLVARLEKLRAEPALARRMAAEVERLSAPRRRELLSLLEAELSEDCEVLCAADGRVTAIEPEPPIDVRSYLAATRPEAYIDGFGELEITTPYGTHRSLIARDRKLTVAVGNEVLAGQVLAEGPLNVHARLFVLGTRSALTSLVGAVSELMDRALEPAELEALLLPLVHGFVRVVERGDTDFSQGEVTTAEHFVSVNDRAMALGARPAVAAAVFVGLSE